MRIFPLAPPTSRSDLCFTIRPRPHLIPLSSVSGSKHGKEKGKMEVAPLDYASHCYAKAASENGGGGGKTKRGGGFDKWSFWKEYSGREGRRGSVLCKER